MSLDEALEVARRAGSVALSNLGPEQSGELQADNKYLLENLATGVELTFMSTDKKAAFRATEEGKKYYDALQRSNEGWAMAYAAAADHKRQQDELVRQALESQKDDQRTLTPTGLRAQQAGFTVIRRGKKAETKKTPTIVDFFSSDSKEKKKSA